MLQHVAQLLACAVIVGGPLPLSLAIVTPDIRRVPARWLASLLVWCLTQLSIGLLLGVVAQLRLQTVLGLEAGTFVGGLALSDGRALHRVLPGRAAFNGSERFLVSALGVVALSLLFRLAAFPITDHDSLAYHLPTMARWYQTHALVLEPLDHLRRYSRQIARYPYGWELVCSLFLLPFSSDFLVALPNLIGWVILGLAVYLLATDFGARRSHALSATFLVLATPLARRQIGTMHVDLALGAFFMAGTYFACAYRTTGSRTCGALALAAAGMVAGIKTSGLVYGLAVLVLLATAGRRATSDDAFHWSRPAVAAAGVAAGTFWYARNLLQTGNPLGYVRVAVAGFTIFPGSLSPEWLAHTTLAFVFQPISVRHWTTITRAVWHELGLAFVFITVAVLALLGRGARRAAPPPGPAGMLFAFAVLTFLAYTTTPFSGTIVPPPAAELSAWAGQAFRYAFPFVGVLTVMAALGARGLPGSAALPVLPVVTVLAGMTNLVLAWALGVFAAAYVSHRAIGGIGRWRTPAAASLLVVALVGGTLALRHRREAERVRAYGGVPEFLTSHLRGGETVGFALSQRTYVFYGSDLQNPVRHVPAFTESRDDWIESLRRARVGLIAVGPIRQEWRDSRELSWLTAPDSRFVRVFGDDAARGSLVFRFRADGAE